ncbi:50S ribosomal protein L31 [Candidatus Dojkabacteria bacterium]|nr:50S ribosomal protein L31 [Candidatus Dojkabacteria bacterium]
MKKGIHPQLKMCTFTDISSGKKFVIGSTADDMKVEISSASHPFYTGEAKIIDTENRVDSFTRKQTAAAKMSDKVKKKKKKKEDRKKKGKVSKIKGKKALTLRDMLKDLQ